eukprot:CAMPEP_0119322140 /NCGR_PEP_ID=MMETSP1333-20130426/57367_1 /TAXON_ID=418940 /ORGANISM="Scyphosphaera apsteinii, Strain RCC1455" /LENGTH=191 /DNA_ID=CAMNT_0007329287 /DNA_START=98 /DNA_END=670 /DNA_ORIENTATION=+
MATRQLVLDRFVLRQFDDPDYSGTRILYDKERFESTCNQLLNEGKTELVNGYAPFCKHLFIPNFTPATLPYLPITDENEHLLKSGYDARTEQELPVLVRWFPLEAVPSSPVAKYIDVILYSREQIRKEATAMGRTDDQTEPWGIISVKAQDVDYELPMQPITMMRNALGAEEGGSGVALNKEAYLQSVEFW